MGAALDAELHDQLDRFGGRNAGREHEHLDVLGLDDTAGGSLDPEVGGSDEATDNGDDGGEEAEANLAAVEGGMHGGQGVARFEREGVV